MGIIKEAPQPEGREEPDFPDGMDGIYSHYKRLKFWRMVADDVVTLMPRSAIGFTDIRSYCRLHDVELSPHDVQIIMDIDALFEGRENVGHS
jgi:hypothetical protein